MRCCRSLAGIAIGAALVLGAGAEIPSWLQWLPASSPASAVLYRLVPGLEGPVSIRRPPEETAPELLEIADALASDAALIALAAREYEAALDFVNAERLWQRFANASSDPVAGQIALADYYHRRLQPQRELAALRDADGALPAIDDPLMPPEAQRSWGLHERVQSLVALDALGVPAAADDYDAWIDKYPEEAALYERYFDFLIEHELIDEADVLLARYTAMFPEDAAFPLRARAAAAGLRGSSADAIALYDQAFDPLWPGTLLSEFFRLLEDSRRIFGFYQDARQATLERPLDLEPATRLFHYYRHRGEWTAAGRELAEYRVRRETGSASWTAIELRTLARLADSINDHEEAIRYAYALYSLPGDDDREIEAALVQIISTLLEAPDQPIRFGRGDLSFYRDIATIDSAPGFLNGILSMLFNSRDPAGEFAAESRKSEAYFHRATADALYRELSERFPDSPERSRLLSGLITSYAQYGEDDAIIRQGTAFIDEFPEAPERTTVALQVADAHARGEETAAELAVYDRLLAELAAGAEQVPLGPDRPRSAGYAEVLSRYVSRLRQLERVPDAVALYRSEIDRNPSDPGLYDQLADFLGANQRAPEVEAVYRQAIGQFDEPSWWHKLARFYLRTRETQAHESLSREFVDAFAGSEVEAYVNDVVADGALERRLQVEINRYALERFPHDLRFVENLVGLYSGGATSNRAALTALLANYWHEDENFRRRYFEILAADGSLGALTDAARDFLLTETSGDWSQAEAVNPALTRFLGEAEAWRSHFEEAAPVIREVAESYPADAVAVGRAADIHRSLAAYDPGQLQIAVALVEGLSASEPRNRAWPVRVGDIYADRGGSGALSEAADVWVRLPAIEPGNPDGYLETATLFWDYLQPEEARNWLARGREALNDPTLWSYEMGAVLEALGQGSDAVQEYVRGAFGPRSGPARERLLELATRPAYRDLVDALTLERVDSSPGELAPIQLRVTVLEAQDGRSDIEPFLERMVEATEAREVLAYARGTARSFALSGLEELVVRREIAIEADPEERLRLRLDLARLFESRGDLDRAQATIESIYDENPLISGVVRATADFFWRHDQDRAVSVLRTAADSSHSSLRPAYLVETARKAIDTGLGDQATAAAADLLSIDPIEPRGIALMAEALTLAGRSAEVQAFYASKIDEVRAADISETDRTDRIALLRRGLIPLLIDDSREREALDQFIEIVNRYPDDEAVLADATRHARTYGLTEVLVGYYEDTARESPADPRWPIVLARLYTGLEDYDRAIAAWGRAMDIRPERMDLALARATLEERTYRFEEAIGSYERVYQLDREAPAWLERIAVLQLRLGRTEDALESLRRAYIDDRPEAAREYGRMAVVLEEHGQIHAAADAISLESPERFRSPAGSIWAPVYSRLMTAAGRWDEALDVLVGLDELNWTRAMGEAAARYLVPEDRQVLRNALNARRLDASPAVRLRLTEVARSGGLHDLEAEWLLADAADAARRAGPGTGQLTEASLLADLERRRMRYSDLGQRLEDLAAAAPANLRNGLLTQAQGVWRAIGDTEAELRLFETASPLQVANRSRYYELLADASPDALVRDAALANDRGLVAARVLIAAGDRERAVQAIRAQQRTEVWRDAYTGLVGVYFGADAPEVMPPFEQILATPVIGDRIGRDLDRDRQLAGDLWFYYGQRYGEYLADSGATAPGADYLASRVELAPRDPEAYLELARYHADSGNAANALIAYGHALELRPDSPGVWSEIGAIELDRGREDAALEAWRTGLRLLTDRPDPSAAAGIVDTIRTRGEFDRMRPTIETTLEAATSANEVWELLPFLQAVFEGAAPDDDRWMLDVVGASRSPDQLRINLSNQTWLESRQLGLVLESALQGLSGTGSNQVEYRQVRQRYLNHLIELGEAGAATALLDTFGNEERRTPDFHRAEARLAVLDGSLQSLLERYRNDPLLAPADQTLQELAAALERGGRAAESRQVREYLYLRQIEASPGRVTAVLGLAEIRLQEERPADAVDLLRRLERLSPEPFESLLASGRLLAEYDQPAAAREFLERRLSAVPWDGETRLELARPGIRADDPTAARHLDAVIRSGELPYDLRTAAAREQGAIQPAPVELAGSRELDLLTGRIPMTVANAGASGFFAARLAAAEDASPELRYQLLLGALAERPDESDARKQFLSAALATTRYAESLAAYPTTVDVDFEIARSLAEASLALGRPSDAVRYFAIAIAQGDDPEARLALEAGREAAQSAYDRILEDERRRPVMREDLDQPGPVRRRLP